MYANLYLKIAEKLDQYLNTAPIIADHGKLDFIARFNNQFTSDDQELALSDPAILIQFLDTEWQSKSRGIQEGDTLIVLHVGVNSIADDNYFSDNKDKALLIDAYMDLVHKAMQGFQADCIGSLDRISSAEDANHDEKFVQTMTYKATITDNSASTAAKLTEKKVDVEVVREKTIVTPETSSPYVIP